MFDFWTEKFFQTAFNATKGGGIYRNGYHAPEIYKKKFFKN